VDQSLDNTHPPILRDLYLDGNELTGTVPSIKSGELELLNEFLLQGNKLVGVMPSSVCNLRDEFILDDLFSDCGGEDPEFICDFPDCCNRCFNGEESSSSRRVNRGLLESLSDSERSQPAHK
jgi:hypothetical protein